MSEQGGYRVGTQGESYSNRSDLQRGPRQPVRATKGQTYGKRGRQEQAQSMLPLPDVSGIPKPGEVPSLTAPTTRPNEPVTAGMTMGAGPGPQGMSVPASSGSQALFDLRALAAQYPEYEGLHRLIAFAEENQ